MVKASVIMCDSQVKYITWLCQGAKVRYSGQLRGEAGGFKAGSAKHPCVHEIRVSTSDSCCWVVTVKQIMSAGGSGNNSTELLQTWK